MDLHAAHPDVLVLVGTQTGNSETVADAVADRLADLGFDAHVVDMAEAYPEMLGEYRQVIVVMCTWSDGTFPDNGKDFQESLPVVAPDLAAVRFGIIGLGDREYRPYYQTAAIWLGDRLQEFGATEVQPMHEIDGTPTPDDVASALLWTDRLATAFAEPVVE
ncbi:MAG: flavodoxin family protein [Bacteroidota bacterium]